MFNAITQAFIDGVSPYKAGAIPTAVYKTAASKAGSHRFKDGWSTKLSFRTYQKLKAEGFVS